MTRAFTLLLLLCSACGDDDSRIDAGGDASTDANPPATLRSGAEVRFVEVYAATSYTEGATTRQWLPMDLGVHPNGELWVVQHMERDPAFDDESECPEASTRGAPNDCVAVQGSTVAISDPAANEPATEANGRVRLIVDANSWHFMRRPSGIAFGAEELRIEPTDPGAEGAGLTETLVIQDTFGTCHEHWTGNFTDEPPFIGPSLWTADPNVYDGRNGPYSWSNGSHLDMVHATQYCMGIAYEGGNAYWVFNGAVGSLDRYDFVTPHHPGHYEHDDAIVSRHHLPESDVLARVETVPSNMVMDGTELFVADTGNGRVLRVDTTQPGESGGVLTTYEGIEGQHHYGIAYSAMADRAALEGAWGGTAEPSGLAVLDADTLVVANHATGHLSLLDRDGSIVRTIDTGTGPGIGGMTVLDGTLYFVQMDARTIVRVDVVTP